MEHFFQPNSSTDLRSDAHHSQIIGGDADGDHTQIFGGDTVKLLRGIIPPGVWHPCRISIRLTIAFCDEQLRNYCICTSSLQVVCLVKTYNFGVCALVLLCSILSI